MRANRDAVLIIGLELSAITDTQVYFIHFLQKKKPD